MRKPGYAIAAWALVTAGLVAAEVWETKPFMQWSDKELQKVLTDSPWSGRASLTHARQGAGLGSVPDWKLIVSVRSALPIKQALVREQVGATGTPSAEHEQLLATTEDMYVLSLSGIPQSMAARLQATADAAALKRRGKPAIAATQASVMMFDRNGRPMTGERPQASRPAQIITVAQRGGGFGGGAGDDSGITATLVLGFPKADPITAQDQEFEFTTVVGSFNVKKTFKLKDMTFKGALAL